MNRHRHHEPEASLARQEPHRGSFIAMASQQMNEKVSLGMTTPPDPPADTGRAQLSTSGRRHQVAAVLTLFLLSPLLGEVVGAALRLSNFVEPLRVVSILCFYGAGVVLIREIAQRVRLNGWGIVLLGLAYALIEEGLALQTIFNPNGVGEDTVYGRAAGVNWFWAVLVCGYHVVWSVLVPIGVVHILFPRQSRSPWLSRRMLPVFGGVFAVGTALFTLVSLLRSDFRPSVTQIGAVLAIVGLLIWAASRCRVRDTPRVPGRLPGTTRAGWTGLGFGLVWFAFHLMAFIGSGTSFVWWVLAAVLVAVAAAAIVARWMRRGWTAQHQLAASFGAVLAAGLFGLLLVSLTNRLVDVVFEVIVIGGIVAGYVWTRRRVGRALPAGPVTLRRVRPHSWTHLSPAGRAHRRPAPRLGRQRPPQRARRHPRVAGRLTGRPPAWSSPGA
ncbi:hypothetical protein ACTMTI_54605 [Nonomuraea sp. H19]|uniref:hypothetical protein n=1 Tax=Nonomuraea sp. H19 TaxID=3452206 RepID=UPI003F88AF2A